MLVMNTEGDVMKLNIVVCDRCGRVARISDARPPEPDGWACVWRRCVTPVNVYPGRTDPQDVCPRCLRADERQQLVEQRELDYGIPF
jgi:hypothetical protein